MGLGTVLGARGLHFPHSPPFSNEASSIVSSTGRPADCLPAVSQVWQSHPNRTVRTGALIGCLPTPCREVFNKDAILYQHSINIAPSHLYLKAT